MSMNSMKNSRQSRIKVLATGTVLMAMITGVGVSESSAADWQYGLKLYGWLPDLSGELNYSPPGSSGEFSVDADQIIGALDFTLMGSFEARNGAWGGFTDLIYLNLGGDKSKSVSLPDDATGTLFDAEMDIEGWVWTLGGFYSVWSEQKSHMDLLAGIRLLSLDTELKLTGGGPLQQDLKLSESVDLWDGIIGMKGSFALNDDWFLPYYIDVGAGDSDLTWQVAGGVGYAFDWGEVTLMYRHLEYDQGSGEPIQDLAFSGGMLGVGFRF